MLHTVVKFILTVVEVLVSLMLVGVILIQKPKSQGMGLAFGAGMGETLFGAQVGNVLTKITVVLSAIFLMNTMALGYLAVGKSGSSQSVVDKSGPVATAPAIPSTPGTSAGGTGPGSSTPLPDAVMPPPEMPEGAGGAVETPVVPAGAEAEGTAVPDVVIPAVVPTGDVDAAPEAPKAEKPAEAPKAE